MAVSSPDLKAFLVATPFFGGLSDASLDLLISMLVERRFDANGQLKTVSEAIVKVVVDGEEKMSVAEGHGPVNALDIALRKDLGKFQNEIDVGPLPDMRFGDSQDENIKKGRTVANAISYYLDDLVTPVDLVATPGLSEAIGKATYKLR